MAYTTIDDPEAYFQVQLYTGTGSSLAVTLDGDTDMQPDFVWAKNRGQAEGHNLFDSVRGVTKFMKTNNTDTEGTGAETLKSFDSDGFTVGTDADMNTSNEKNVAWCWKESATAGFDILIYTGNETARTISHSLSAVPHMMIIKNRGTTGNWAVYHLGLGSNNKRLELDGNAASDTGTSVWNDTDPTSSVFSVGNNDRITNGNTMTYVGYLFAPKQGFSKFGSYTGNGNADGPFIYTGFRPAWVMFKPDASADWTIVDNKRNTVNPVADNTLNANLQAAEHDGSMDTDFCSNGFKIRNANTDNNNSGLIVYAAFAEAPFVNSNGVPCNAR